jgi:hypothetical protein
VKNQTRAAGSGGRSLAGCTQGAASIKLSVCAGCVMTTKTDWTDWIQITTGLEGRAIRGSYAVEDGMVKVKTPRGERAAQVEGLSNPIWLAVWLLRELAKEGKA